MEVILVGGPLDGTIVRLSYDIHTYQRNVLGYGLCEYVKMDDPENERVVFEYNGIRR